MIRTRRSMRRVGQSNLSRAGGTARRRTGVVLLATVAMAISSAAALAQISVDAHPGIYRPNSALDSPPLRVEVLDGVRFRDIETHNVYRLYGIDACALGQIASLGRQPWPCGAVAVAWLVNATLNRWIACNTLRLEGAERLARCSSADHADIAADMLRGGIAVAPPSSTGDLVIHAYVAAEAEARKAYRGIWASSFEMPWEFRARAAHSAALGATAR
jgi:endonuclease YncB( thermonuclease family)